MLRRMLDMVGLPVIGLDSGRMLGSIRDIVFNEELEILGFIHEERKRPARLRLLEAGEAAALEEDAVMAADAGIREIGGAPGVHTLFDSAGIPGVRGKAVLTGSGKLLGTVEDVYFDTSKGRRLAGFELSNGFISDLMEGRKWLPLAEPLAFGEDALILAEPYAGRIRDILPLTKE